MQFDAGLLETYRQLIQTTSLADGYGEFVRLFRFLRVQMEKERRSFAVRVRIWTRKPGAPWHPPCCTGLPRSRAWN